jgi:thioredoxin-related protein
MSKILLYIGILIFILPVASLSGEIDFDIDREVRDANISNKYIALFIHKDNCGYCERMELLLDKDDILKIINRNFVLLDIDRDEDDERVSYQGFKGTNREFIKALDIDFFPTLVFIDTKEDKIIHWELGYRDREKLLTLLEYISSKSYKTKSLEDFKDEKFFNE